MTFKNCSQHRFGLLGRNISYSLSPLIQNGWMKDLSWPYIYEIFDIDSSEIDCFLKKGNGWFNVTTPYKELLFSKMTHLSLTAQKVGAINTFKIKDHQIIGHNTDVLAIINLLRPFAPFKRVCILGLGGAAKGADVAVRSLGAKSIVYVNRSLKQIHKEWTISFDKIKNYEAFDLIISATPHIPIDFSSIPIHHKSVVFDMIYRPIRTKLIHYFEKKCHVILGMQMLVLQGAFSLEWWAHEN